MNWLDAIQRRDPHRIFLAPLLGLAAGFLLNRAHHGGMGGALAAEMLLGAAVMTLGALLAKTIAAMRNDARLQAQAALRAQQAAELAAQAQRHRLLIAAEAAQYNHERLAREQTLNAMTRVAAMERELFHSRRETRELRDMLARTSGGDSNGLLAGLQQAQERIAALEVANAHVLEARQRLAALEEAQAELAHSQIKLSETAKLEAEEVKNRLRLVISDSQRQRNIESDERAESGRILELEQRIRKLARELEKLSGRAPAVADEGVASLVAPGGTKDVARAGFLKALLDANQTLRRQIKQAA